jgi:hypothetical protein
MEGKLLSGIVGHNVCLDYFGSPSPEEAKLGLSQHGEAPSSKWRIADQRISASGASIRLGVHLPAAGLGFSREIRLRRGESVIYFQETVVNERKADHFFHWVQHVTLGPPFITAESSRIVLPGTRGLTFPHGYDEGKALLAARRTYRWPMAPRVTKGFADLTRPFSFPGLGFVVGVLVDPRRDMGFVAAFNQKEHLVFGYCFWRRDFPWVAVWEENLAIEAIPWNRRTQALGLEFGTTPLPVTRRENFLEGAPLFGIPTITFAPALSKKRVRYVSFLASVPPEFEGLRDIRVGKTDLVLFGTKSREPRRLLASDIGEVFPR